MKSWVFSRIYYIQRALLCSFLLDRNSFSIELKIGYWRIVEMIMKNPSQHFAGAGAKEGSLWFMILKSGSNHRLDLCFLSRSLDPKLSRRLKKFVFIFQLCCFKTKKKKMPKKKCLFIILLKSFTLWLIRSRVPFCFIVNTLFKSLECAENWPLTCSVVLWLCSELKC